MILLVSDTCVVSHLDRLNTIHWRRRETYDNKVSRGAE